MKQQGQFSTDVGNIIALIVLIAIGAFVTYAVTDAFGEDIQQNTHTTDQREFVDDSSWTLLANGENLTIVHNSTGEYVDIGATGPDDNNVYIFQDLEIDDFESVNSATMEAAVKIDNADNLASENMYLRLIDPSNNTEVETTVLDDNSSTSSWFTTETDVGSAIDEDGTWEVEVYADIAVDNDGFNTQVDNVQLTASTTTYAGSAISNVEDKGNTSFNLMTILVIVIIAAVIIGVVLRALAGGRTRGGGPAPAY